MGAWLRYALVAGSLLFALGASVRGVRAEDVDYATTIRDAIAEYDAGRYEEAAALFERAHAKSPSARTHRGLGLAYFQSRKYSLAVRHLRAALSDTRRPLSGTQRAEAERFLKQALHFVARFKLVLDPADAEVQADGHEGERQGDELLLDPGQHELIVHAPEHQDERRIVEAIAGSSSELEIKLAPSAPSQGEQAAARVEAPPVGAPLPQQPTRQGQGRGIGPYIVAGAGGALLVGALVTGLVANGLYDKLDRDCPKGACSDPKLISDRNTGKTLVVTTNVLLVTGLVAVAAGATFWLLAPSGSHETRVAAVCAPGGCALSLAGRL